MGLGENIKKYRKMRGLTQQELAERANMSRSYLADVERNRYNPSVDTLKSIAKALQINSNDLLSDDPNAQLVQQNQSALSPKEERDIAKDLERVLSDLESDQVLAFHGEAMDEESKELLRISLENSMRLAKQIAKQKFTPKKHRK